MIRSSRLSPHFSRREEPGYKATCNNNTQQQSLILVCTMVILVYVVLLYYKYVLLLYDHSNIMHRLFYDAALCSSVY